MGSIHCRQEGTPSGVRGKRHTVQGELEQMIAVSEGEGGLAAVILPANITDRIHVVCSLLQDQLAD